MELSLLNYDIKAKKITTAEEQSYTDNGLNDINYEISEFDLNIMEFSREMIIFGVKDLETMAALHHVLEAIYG